MAYPANSWYDGPVLILVTVKIRRNLEVNLQLIVNSFF
jgi:hypothetical protein